MYFDGAGAPPATSVSTVQGPGSSCNRLELAVRIRGVTDIDKVEFTVAYNASRVEYVEYSMSGSVLESDGTDADVTENAQPGVLGMVLDRPGALPGVDAVDAETLVILYFDRITDNGFSNFAFSNEAVWGSENPPMAKVGIPWYGGTIWLD
jgi:hypothetical protein